MKLRVYNYCRMDHFVNGNNKNKSLFNTVCPLWINVSGCVKEILDYVSSDARTSRNL